MKLKHHTRVGYRCVVIAAVYSLLPDSKTQSALIIDDGIIYRGSMFKQKFNGQGTVKFKNDATYVGHLQWAI